MTKQTTDFLIIGGGIIGINMALNARERYPAAKITLIEKEPKVGLHASGRNSGVLHAGFYYTSDSLKAKFTRDGNKALTSFCTENKLKINRCGKLVVVKNESELPAFQTLIERGKKNEVEINEVTEKEAKEIEPRAKTFQKALFSPTTSSVDPVEVVNCMYKNAINLGIEILVDTCFIKKTNTGIQTNKGDIDAGYIINTAGLYADKIAKEFDFCKDYTIVPFKGLYIYGSETSNKIKTHIYPVPNLKNPFLGVHFTITADNKVKLGPTAIPAFWREHYKGMDNFKLNEFIDITTKEAGFFVRNDFKFRTLAFNEFMKYRQSHMVKLASELASDLKTANYKKRGAAGIRAQLLNTTNRTLEMDFKFEGDHKSFHILNAVSPAFTCSIPFTNYLFNQIETLVNN